MAPPIFSGWPCDKEGYNLQSRVDQFPQSDFVGVLIHDRPSLSRIEAVAVGRAMLQVAEALINKDSHSSTDSKLRRVKDIAAPAKVGDPNPPMPNIEFDMFATSVADLPIPNFGSPGDRPYFGGFDLSAIDEALRETLPIVQDMSTLVLDNAHFGGEVGDERDRQWYSHLPSPDIGVADNQPIDSNVIADFQTYTAHNRSILSEQEDQIVIVLLQMQ